MKGLLTVPEERNSETAKPFFANAFSLLKQTFQEWLQDKAPQLGAALAYYTVFSLAPLVLVLLAIVGIIFRDNPAGAWDKITQQMSYFLDQSAVEVVQSIAQKASQPGKGLIATIIGVALALFGASGVFGQLQDASAFSRLQWSAVFVFCCSSRLSSKVCLKDSATMCNRCCRVESS